MAWQRNSRRGSRTTNAPLVMLVLLFACRSGRRPPPGSLPAGVPFPPETIAVTLPPDTTVWVQDLVHSGRHVYGLSLHFGEPRVPGLWRASIDGGGFSLLRFLSESGECQLPLNSFDLSDGALRARFFCPDGCAASPCLAGRIHDETGPTMPYQGELEAEWKPLLGRGARGVVDRFRYRIDEIRLSAEGEPGRLLLRRDDHPFRGREP